MDGTTKHKRKLNPGQNANYLSQITFCFALPIFRLGLKNFKETDVYAIINSFSSKTLGDKLEIEWEVEKKKKEPSLIQAIFRIFGFEYLLWGFLSMIINTIGMFIKPNLIGKVVAFFSPKQTHITKEDALVYASLLLLSITISELFHRIYSFQIDLLSLKIRTACSTLIYRKVLKYGAGFSDNTNGGLAVTLITKDTLMFENAMFMLLNLFVAMVQLIAMTYVMYVQIGVSAFAGISLLLLFAPIQAYLGIKTIHYRLDTAGKTDQRLQLFQEILSAIKVIKMYSWELFFCKSIDVHRKKEVAALRMVAYLRALCMSIGLLNYKLTLYVTIVIFVALGNHITAEKAYVIIGCYAALRLAITVHIPHSFIRVGELKSALIRLNNYLIVKDQSECIILERLTEKQPRIEFKNVTVSVQGSSILQSLNASVVPGVTLVTGAIGSGKSVLVKTVLGVFPGSGVIKVSGKVSYASQEPWLFPGTIKQNIIFNEPFNKARYDNVIQVCALQKDFDMLPLGDVSLVIDKGLNLSKGQKARINLARAIYKSADVYLLDDCLAAVDLQIGRYIFYECMKKFLQNKVCLLVSHQHRFLHEADDILILSKGFLKFHGTYKELTNSNLEKHFDEYGIVNDVVDGVPYSMDQNVCDQIDETDESCELLSNKPLQSIYQEKHEEGGIKKEIYQTYFAAGGVKLLITVIVLAIVRQLFESGADYFGRFWVESEQKLSAIKFKYITNSTEYQAAQESHKTIIYEYSIVVLSILIFTALTIMVFYVFICRAIVRIHRLLVEKIVNAGMVFLENNLSGNIINRFSRDLAVVDEHLPFSIFEAMRATLSLISILIVVSSVNTWFLIPSAIFTLLLYFGCRLYLTAGRNIRRVEGSTRSPVIGHMQATFDGLSTIQANQASEIVKDEFDAYSDVYNSTQYMHFATQHGFSLCMDILGILFIAVVVFGLLLFDNSTGAGKVGLAITQSFILSTLIQWCLRQWSEMDIKMTSAERVLEYVNVEPESRSGLIIENWPKMGKIEFKNVNLRYTKLGQTVLNNVSFVIEPNEMIGIVGRTGAGKTSIISTLFRLYTFEGTILVDDVDINTLKISELRSKISIIPQDPILFSGTMRTNLDPYHQYSDQHLWNVLEIVEMKDKIDNLDQIISDNGSSFSNGEKQLICLACAAVQDNQIIVLDEATANVDTQTDTLIQQTIRKIFANRTIIIIAHRLHTIMDCNKVIVLDSGTVIEYDKPGTLLKNKNGAFYKMSNDAGLVSYETA